MRADEKVSVEEFLKFDPLMQAERLPQVLLTLREIENNDDFVAELQRVVKVAPDIPEDKKPEYLSAIAQIVEERGLNGSTPSPILKELVELAEKIKIDYFKSIALANIAYNTKSLLPTEWGRVVFTRSIKVLRVANDYWKSRTITEIGELFTSIEEKVPWEKELYFLLIDATRSISDVSYKSKTLVSLVHFAARASDDLIKPLLKLLIKAAFEMPDEFERARVISTEGVITGKLKKPWAQKYLLELYNLTRDKLIQDEALVTAFEGIKEGFRLIGDKMWEENLKRMIERYTYEESGEL